MTTTDCRTNAPDDGPGCGHEPCLFLSECAVVQAEAERAEAYLDRLDRREMGRDLAHKLGLSDAEGPLFEVVAYSPDLACRIAAGDLIVGALERLAREAA
jgi:hypothetical protein